MKAHILIFNKYRGLLSELVKRDLKTKYRRSILGFLWSLLNPLFTMLVMTFVFSYIFKNELPNFPIYLLTGQVLFNFFSEATSSAMGSIVGGSALIKKVYIPKYIFPLAKVLSSFVNLLFSLSAVVIVMVILRVKVSWSIILFPLPLIYVLLFSIGIGLALSALTVFFRDIMHLYGVILTAWLYMTPIFYPVSAIAGSAALYQVIKFNPMYRFIDCFRIILWQGKFPPLYLHLICLACGIISIIIGTVIFYKTQDKFILYI